MKSIEECYDMVLEELIKNWNKPDNKRDDLDADGLLKKFELPEYMQKHEFLKRLIRNLVKDGNAEYYNGEPLFQTDPLDWYKKNTLITIEGYYMITSKWGYEKQKIKNETAEILADARDKRLANGTVLLAVGTGLLLVWELLKYFDFEGHWFSLWTFPFVLDPQHLHSFY